MAAAPGRWIRDRARSELDRPADEPRPDQPGGTAAARCSLLLWYLLPHPLWDRRPGTEPGTRRPGSGPTCSGSGCAAGRSGALWYRAMQPTLGLLWAEAAGQLSYRSTWMYVTDGGHYDNLGLVEALRRGASNIVVLDASGDKANTWSTLGGAIALARADAGVEIELDPTTMTTRRARPGPGPGRASPWAHGTFSRPQPVPGLPAQGEIWVCKLGWWAGAPWDVRAYAKSHSHLPRATARWSSCTTRPSSRPTTQLGVATVRDAAKNCAPKLRWAPPPVSAPALPRWRPSAGPGHGGTPARPRSGHGNRRDT